MSFNEIGEILGISPHTVTAHIKKIYRKLAVAFARRSGVRGQPDGAAQELNVPGS